MWFMLNHPIEWLMGSWFLNLKHLTNEIKRGETNEK